jgi:hypothetical protein
MFCSRWKTLPIFLFLTANIFAGCGGGGGGGTTTHATPQFTSTPVMGAEEGTTYTYQVTASSSDMSAITFALSSGPIGATLAGNTITWTPTHPESRTANAFLVTATTAAGGSATQTWSVTPNGTINIKAVITYWTPAGSTDVPRQWLADLPYPAALVPQTDGSLQRLQGATNADGTFSIPNVPSGFYWLQISPAANFWTSTSDFDYGFDTIGQPRATTSSNTTTFQYIIIQTVPPNVAGYLVGTTDVQNLSLLDFISFPLFTSLGFSRVITSPTDWSEISTAYFSEFLPVSSGSFSGYALGRAQTLTNVSITDGDTNPVNVTLSPTPAASLPLSIMGTAWVSAAQSIGPGTPSLQGSDYAVYAQPYVIDRNAYPVSVLFVGPDLPLLRPSVQSSTGSNFPFPYLCSTTTGPTGFPVLLTQIPPITTDVDYGSVSYGDPYPAGWPRMLQYCEMSIVSVPRPNSTATDTFVVTNKQTTALPSGAVTPLLTPVQNPTLNGNSLFTGASLNTTSVTLSWTAPATGQPFGFYVSVYELATTPLGTTGYLPAGRYGTAQTSVKVPFLTAGNTYVFTITAEMDAGADMEKSPLRSKVPSAETGVVSAPVVIAAGATAAVKR